jgi:3-oxoadipate enol-lactonase
VLSNTAAYLGPPDQWDRAISELQRAPDLQATAEMFLRNWFPASMLDAADDAIAPFRRTLLATAREGIAGSWAAIRDADLRRTLRVIDRPTLVIAGAHDTVTSVEHGEAIAAAIPGHGWWCCRPCTCRTWSARRRS